LGDVRRLADSAMRRIIRYAKSFKEPLVDDLGDYIPFLVYLGEREFCENHIKASSPKICIPLLPTEREDTLLGLIEFYRWTGKELSLNLAKEYIDYLFSNYYYKGRIVVSKNQYIERVFALHRKKSLIERSKKIMLKLIHNFSGTRLSIPRNGIFIELLVDMYDLTGDEKYLQMAEDLVITWIRDRTFRKYGLFPSFHLNPFKASSTLFKDNTALLNGLIALYERTKEDKYKSAILKWSQSLHARCFRGSIWGKYYFRSGKLEELSLLYAFPSIDVLCYAYFVLGEENLLSFAEKIAEFWIPLQSEIGLFPINPSSNVSHQDMVTDFCISLWGLYEHTGNNMYREKSEKAMEGLFKFHVFPLKVDYQSGEIVDPTEVPKFITLMLKPIILLKEERIYKNKKIFKLLRDR